MNHHLSPACAALVRCFEGCRLVAYLPTPADRPTIGWGATFDEHGVPIRLGARWTQARADARLAADLAVLAGRIGALLGSVTTTTAQFDALVSFGYNVGLGALARSTLLRLHRVGDHDGAARQFARWTKQGGAVLPGLERRRAAEAALYRSNVRRGVTDAGATGPMP